MAFQSVDNEKIVESQDHDKLPDSQESLILFSQETFETIEVSQKTSDLLSDVMHEPDDLEKSIVPFDSIPELSPFDQKIIGSYGFQIAFIQEERLTKSCPWTFSKIMKKLYMGMNIQCPFLVNVSKSLPPGTNLCAALFYKREEDYASIPVRCPVHASKLEPYNYGVDNSNHLILSDLKEAVYKTCPEGRPYVVVPLRSDGSKSFYNFKIMCRNSCEGGISRRSTVMVFTLENRGFCLGKFSVEVRVCSCPGRDRLSEEKKEDIRALQDDLTFQNSTSLPGKRIRPCEYEDNGGYEITTTNKKVFKVLYGLNQILERFIPPR